LAAFVELAELEAQKEGAPASDLPERVPNDVSNSADMTPDSPAVLEQKRR
jgi:hypothetical protein